MILIEISGSEDTLEDLFSEINDVFKNDQIKTEIGLQRNRFDGEITDVCAILSVTFSALTLLTNVTFNVINLILKLQEAKQSAAIDSKGETSILIRTGNEREFRLNVTQDIAKEEVESYLASIQRFEEDALKLRAQFSVLSGTCESCREGLDILKINGLFESLISNTQQARKTLTTVVDNGDGKITARVNSIQINLLSILKEDTNTAKFYLPIKDVDSCESIFFAFEVTNIMDFQKDDIKVLNMKNTFVGYRIKKLAFFQEVIENPSFAFYDFFRNV